MFTVELTKLEREQMLQCLDIALKQAGLAGASVVLNLASKIQNAKEQKEEE